MAGRQAHRVYLEAIRNQAVRVLGLMDREEFSPTCGCLDRTYWAWKFIDFPGARFQEGLCVLSFLYAVPFEDNSFYNNEKLRRWIAQGFDFWSKIQRPSGDFDEAYPLERSLAATAFTAFYLGEAWKFMGEDLPAATADRFRSAMLRAGDWLTRNDERHGFLSNHLAAAATALYHAFLITEEDRFEQRSRYFVDKILRHQSSEGWYEEYGGADPGYQTHGSFYLARYLELSGDKAVAESLERSFQFLVHFIHPDLSLGGEYASRNTQTYYPAAFELMSTQSPSASWIAKEMLPTVDNLAAVGLGSVDIYNFFPLLNNYVFAYLGAKRNQDNALRPQAPSIESGVVHFPRAGLLKIRRPRYDLFVNLNKGGVLKLFDREKRRLVFNNCGYIGRLRNGKTFSSQWRDATRKIELSDSEVCVEGYFYQISRPLMSPAKFLAFRVFSLTLGRVKRAAYWIKSLLVKVLIYRKRQLDLHFVRRIILHEDGIEIFDRLQGGLRDEVDRLAPGQVFTTIHMGSSRYFIPNELTNFLREHEEFNLPINPASLKAGVERQHRVLLD